MTKAEWKKIRELLGETMHTGFRKGCEAPEAHEISHLITKMDDEDWDHYVSWVFDALQYCMEGK